MNQRIRPQLALSLLITCVCAVPGLALTAMAQEAIPSQANPGLLLPTQADKLPDTKRLPDTTAQPSHVDLDTPEQAPSVQLPAARFQVQKITVEDATIFAPADFAPIVQPFEGREVTLEELSSAVDQINKLYREKGYLTSQAFVPPQEVAGGTVIIRVVEGRVGNVSVTGNKYFKTNAILRTLDLKTGEVFNLKALEKRLNVSNQQNGFHLKAVLSPGEHTGDTDIKFEVAERQPWQIAPTFDNQGRPFIGMYRGGVELSNDSVFGYGDRLSTRFMGADGTRTMQGAYAVPLNGRGDELSLSYGYSHVDVDLGTADDIIGTARTTSLMFSHPFDMERKWVGDIGLNARRVASEFNGDQTDLDKIRSLQTGLSFNKYDRLGRTFARLQTSLGFDAFGGNADFWKTEAMFTRLFHLPANNILIFRGYGQLSPDALPSIEAMQIGGAYSVRGYTEGLIVGDRGYNFTIEDRWPIPMLGLLSPWLADRLQGTVFFDIGRAWNDKSSTRFVSNAGSTTFLMGSGFGLRARLSQYLMGFVDLGFGLVDRSNIEPLSNPTARVHFGVRSELLPTAYKSRDSVQADPTTPGEPPAQTSDTQPEAEATNMMATEAAPPATDAPAPLEDIPLSE